MRTEDSRLFRETAYIGGAWIEGPARYEVVDPATGETLANVVRCTRDDARRAVDAAAAAQPSFGQLTASERGSLLRRMAHMMLEHADDLALLLTREQGKPLTEARNEIRYAASFLDWFGEEARRVYGTVIPTHRGDSRIVVLRQPVGVCAGITPWNFPSAMITRKLGPALAAGNCIVVKPAEATPLSALALAELSHRAGVPAGAFQVLTGSRQDAAELGEELANNPLVRKLSFTGSTRVGKLLARQCASTVKRVSLELGGNAPFIIFDDANLDEALDGLMVAKFRNAGQTCVAANRILVQRGIYDRFAQRLRERIGDLKVGPGTEPGVHIGPLIDEAALAKCENHIFDAVAKGARATVGGARHPLGRNFLQPTLLEGITGEMEISQNETFGPVAGICKFEREEDAIRRANNTPSGLAAYVFTRDVGRVLRASEALEYGMVGANTGGISTEVAPFGGIKESGLGREGSCYGIDDWTELKYVCLGSV